VPFQFVGCHPPEHDWFWETIWMSPLLFFTHE
jgi:hypothetical protein